ncbi:Speckle-type POZ protein [Araneus ventricosus]|uniref:Speckle-type POZ protein n=2 Tax=Araneus ventricosus TaxID=182803 RepID=A0A4Y2KY68_ARAVE|nr:Speckle-type POZ protein [Araneus ventricosus]
MATKTDGEANGCTFQWKIGNISHCWWFKRNQPIVSPAFIADALQGTKWTLWLCPMGVEDEKYVGFHLHREEDCRGPDSIKVKYQLAFLGIDGSFLEEKTESDIFQKGGSWGFSEFKRREKVFVSDKEAFLPEDTLTVQCTIWSHKKTPVKPKYLYARTIFNVNRRSFDWRIDKFSILQPGLRNKFKDDSVEFDLVLNRDFDAKLDIDVISLDYRMQYISCNTSIIDSDGKIENVGIAKYFLNDLKKGILSPALQFPKRLLENKSRYLPNDGLSLHFEFVISTVEHFGCRKYSANLENEVVVKEKSQKVVLIDALKSMFDDGILSDTELRTSTKTFPAHKNILSARSPVFMRMFSDDMKEKNSGYVDITDLEDDTVHRMLLYIYTDSLEDLQVASAAKLYEAADKYAILPLRSLCSSFLKENLRPSNACRVLVLADLHNDDDLKSSVQDYILKQHKQIFYSQKWKDFMNTRLKLAADVMYKKIFQESDVATM